MCIQVARVPRLIQSDVNCERGETRGRGRGRSRDRGIGREMERESEREIEGEREREGGREGRRTDKGGKGMKRRGWKDFLLYQLEERG